MTTPMPGTNESFSSGLDHAVNASGVNDNSLTAQSRMWDQEVQATIGRPHSVLQALSPSANGMSSLDASHRTFSGQYLGNSNGESSQSFTPEAEMKIEDQ